MQRDIEYWETDENVIVVEPKSVKGRTIMVEEFPIYAKAQQYRAYLGNNGLLKWEFPKDSPALLTFFQTSSCQIASVAA